MTRTARWPDFLLIGAPKAGTTALFKAMARHPDVYVSPEKEPRFFAHAGTRPAFTCAEAANRSKSIAYLQDDYLALFRDCPPGKKAGEASTGYLYSGQAPVNARRHVPDARIIVVLRHPVERAYSQWLHYRQIGVEELGDHEAALDAEHARRTLGWSPVWFYRDRGFYAEQLDRWLAHFPRRQILVLFYEDWKARPDHALRRVFEHIGVDPSRIPAVTRENVSSRQPRWKWLHHRMEEDNTLRRWARRRMPLWMRDAITLTIKRFNLKAGPKLDPALRRRLAAAYQSDIERLEALTGRDLEHSRR